MKIEVVHSDIEHTEEGTPSSNDDGGPKNFLKLKPAYPVAWWALQLLINRDLVVLLVLLKLLLLLQLNALWGTFDYTYHITAADLSILKGEHTNLALAKVIDRAMKRQE